MPRETFWLTPKDRPKVAISMALVAVVVLFGILATSFLADLLAAKR